MGHRVRPLQLDVLSSAKECWDHLEPCVRPRGAAEGARLRLQPRARRVLGHERVAALAVNVSACPHAQPPPPTLPGCAQFLSHVDSKDPQLSCAKLSLIDFLLQRKVLQPMGLLPTVRQLRPV
jgi:hypothetical protein